ncbi:hypothetical protein D0863_05397 [Hortaea werneckii]|uniref:Carboxylic ester hydrolase n=1 Tax=Hortaea werneckii TaxID=91943 RepID=A0A3M7E3L5_HORWE|nr:hypothetical protein D0863_05397 [Hortaea werneckii]
MTFNLHFLVWLPFSKLNAVQRMPRLRLVAMASVFAGSVNAVSLSELCTVSNVQAAVKSLDILGIDLSASSITAGIANSSSSGGGMAMNKRQEMSQGDSESCVYCGQISNNPQPFERNVSMTYAHTGRDDEVALLYAFPAPSDFTNRFYVAGGGGYSLSSSATGGLEYGAAGGATGAGYGSLEGTSYDDVILYGNGSINWDATYMFGYQALGEMTIVGKPLTKAFYGMANGTKLYTYYEGCSDGGREGMSQVQRWGEEYDGVIAGAPAFRFGQQQVNHVFSAAVEHTMDYYPEPCALEKIVNATIDACDPLDGRTDAETSSSLGFGFSGGLRKRQGAEGSQTSSTPEQNGTVSAQDVEVAQKIYQGLHNSRGERAYLSWQIGSELSDASPSYDNTTGKYVLNIPSTGGEYVTKFVQLHDIDNLADLDGVTYDTLVQWMQIGMVRYLDSLQTTLPDLTAFKEAGGKLLHYHGESDPSVPAASSVHYWQSVKEIMYPSSFSSSAAAFSHAANASAGSGESLNEALEDWYQFYLIPGAAHCNTNSLQPGPYPEDNMQTMINWVESGVRPSRLNATVSLGEYEGEVQRLCMWPQRPLWRGNSSDFDCVGDEASIASWTYKSDAFKLPVY